MRLRDAAAAFALAVIVGCNVEPSVVTSITVQPQSPTLLVGDTIRFHAALGYSGSSPSTPPKITWTSTDSAILSVDDQGLATALRPSGGTGSGRVEILVSAEGYQSGVFVTVAPS